MSDEIHVKIDPNTADEQTLSQLPGVGSVLAQRILAARPFATLEDLQRVSGIGPEFLARLEPYLALAPAAEVQSEQPPGNEAEAAAPIVAPTVETENAPEQMADLPPAAAEPPEAPPAPQAEAQPAPGLEAVTEPSEAAPVPEKEPQPASPSPTETPATISAGKRKPAAAQAPPEKWVTRWQAFGLAIGCSFLALILALVLSLGILASLNGGQLQFASPAKVNSLEVQINGLDSRVGALEHDLQSLRTRVDNLEPLGARVDAIEQTAKQLRTDMDGVNSQVGSLTKQVDDLGTEVTSLQTQSQKITGFLDSLRGLLNEMFGTQDGGK